MSSFDLIFRDRRLLIPVSREKAYSSLPVMAKRNLNPICELSFEGNNSERDLSIGDTANES